MANIGDIMVAMFMLFILAAGMLLSIYVTDQIRNSETSQTYLTEEQRAPMSTVRGVIMGFDNYMLIIFIGLSVVSIITAVFVRTHPVLFVLMMVAQLILLVLSQVFYDVWTQLASTSEFVETANELTYTNLIFKYLPLFTLVISAIVAIVSYGKVTPAYV